MRNWSRAALLGTILGIAATPTHPLLAQGGPPPHVRAAVQSLEEFLEGPGDSAAVRVYAAERLTPSLRAKYPGAALNAHLGALHAGTRGALGGNMSVEMTPEGLRLVLVGSRNATVLFVVEDDGKLSKLELVPTSGDTSSPPAGGPFDNLTWEGLDAAFRAAMAEGFSGVVLARHQGRDLIRTAYGTIGGAGSRPLSLGTVFDIGSTPINFTQSGIEILRREGALALADSLPMFFPDVPHEKRSITIGHLLSGQSGIPDFVEDEGDWDHDLAWIDRATYVRRTLGAPLEFAPGARRQPSHAAIGMLAAIVEVVSGRTYPEFVRARILTPLGMRHTGFYGETLGMSVGDFAIGAGPVPIGLPNIPPNWGPTSWLIMGSGGMVSTLDDLATYFAAVASGTMPFRMPGEPTGEALSVGGTERGFFTLYIANGKGDTILTLENGGVPPPQARRRIDALRRLF